MPDAALFPNLEITKLKGRKTVKIVKIYKVGGHDITSGARRGQWGKVKENAF